MPLLPYALVGTLIAGLAIWMYRRRDGRKAQPCRPFIPAGAATGQVSSANRGQRIGVLIVAYNALTTLSAVLKRIPPDVWEMIEEVAVFDDASPDETYELAIGHKAIFGRDKLKIYRNDTNLGYGGNQKRGYQYFLEKGFDIVIMLHGDGQYAPEILAHLYAPLVAGEADAVFGSRMMSDYGGPLKGGMPLYKFLGNRILTGFANRFLHMNLTEFHSGYRAYSLHALKHIDFTEMTDDFHFDTQIIIKLRHQGFRIKEVPIPTYYGNEICYVNGMKYAKDVFKAVLRYRRTVLGLAKAPEYAEYHVHYALKESRHSSHDYLTRLAGRNHDILEVGCGEGFMSAKLAADGNRIVGIDLLEQPQRRDCMQAYFQADLDGGLGDVAGALQHRRFDCVLLPDVLEHLRRPERVLRDCAALLKRNGLVLVSVPNVANITVRLGLLFGRFQYADRGILDRTHLRFFTRTTARRLLQDSGYEVLDTKMTVMPLELAFGLSPRNPFMVLLNRCLRLATVLLPGLLGYQTILVARAHAVAVAPASLPATERAAA
ncbi:MAG: bifunctional glycosyltransferase/class I SAM-dependent methyltransferase [Gemmataceae bacterium]|nr:bifunctional glycosyltransferase/class I SAM-dependent methyltransferase [Gemmataceae bacterium]